MNVRLCVSVKKQQSPPAGDLQAPPDGDLAMPSRSVVAQPQIIIGVCGAVLPSVSIRHQLLNNHPSTQTTWSAIIAEADYATRLSTLRSR